MAIIPSTEYPSQTDATDTTGYPLGKAQNITTPGDNTGTPLEEAWVNDLWGFFQALLSSAGITASGTADKVGASQYLDALAVRLGTVMPHKIINCVVGDVLVDHTQELDTDAATSSAMTHPRGAMFSADGKRLYIVEGDDGYVFQFDCATPFDVTSAVYDDYFDGSTQLTGSSRALAFNPAGTTMFVGDSTGKELFQYTLSTAWDVTTASYASKSLDTSTEMSGGSLNGIQVTHSGESLWAVCADGLVYRYDLSTAWDLSTGSYASESKDVSATDGPNNPMIAVWSTDGYRLLVVGGDGSSNLEYNVWDCTTAYDLTTATAVGTKINNTIKTEQASWTVSLDGARLLGGAQTADEVWCLVINRMCAGA